MTVIEFIVACTLLLIVVTGWILGIWELSYRFRRRHRLEREADAREARRRLDEDFATIRKELGEGDLTLAEYATAHATVATEQSRKGKVESARSGE